MHCQQWQATQGVRGQRLGDAAPAAARSASRSKKDPDRRRAGCRRPRRLAGGRGRARSDDARLPRRDQHPDHADARPGPRPAGVRVIGRVPRGRWQAVTLLATLTPAGLGPGLQLEGAIDRHSFDTFVTQVLVPTLRPGQTVILDNLSVHKSPRAQAAIEAVGCTLRFLPAYSPDFNPIEQAFSKLKHLLRQAEARTVETILTATEVAYPQITAKDARGFYRESGYNL